MEAPSSAVEICDPSAGDVLECVKIEQIASEHHRIELQEELKVFREQGLLRVARQNGELIGYLQFEKVALGMNFSFYPFLGEVHILGRKDTWYLHQITVSSHHRRKGIGSSNSSE
jgi:ribosomal protein S18 acetylase RimI-like enzyme